MASCLFPAKKLWGSWTSRVSGTYCASCYGSWGTHFIFRCTLVTFSVVVTSITNVCIPVWFSLVFMVGRSPDEEMDSPKCEWESIKGIQVRGPTESQPLRNDPPLGIYTHDDQWQWKRLPLVLVLYQSGGFLQLSTFFNWLLAYSDACFVESRNYRCNTRVSR